MGTTLQNGVYLPNEGERNCYAGLKTNWEILDQKVADVTALQQAVAGALHREIVESLPTTDIDPNTIYMVLSGTSATENVYNEFMYVNNAWELIGTSATDLTNYYTKAEVDGKLLLKANDSDVVHKSGNETINGAKSFNDKMNLLNAVRGIDITSQTIDCNNLTSNASGDIKLYRCTSIAGASNISNIPLQTSFLLIVLQTKYSGASDTRAIQKFYDVGSSSQPISYTRALYNGTWSNWVKDTDKFVTTDTAQTISGNKTFSSTPVIYNSDANGSTQNLYFRNQLVTKGDTSSSGNQIIRFADTNDKMLGRIQSTKVTNGNTTLNLRVDTIDSNNVDVTAEVQIIAQKDGNKSFSPQLDNAIDLGRTLAKWRNLLVNQINGLTPSSLSLPDFANRVDITSYISNLSGSTNTYTPPVNGWLYVGSNDASYLALFDTGSSGCGIRFSDGVVGEKYACIPCQANRTLGVRITCTNLAHAYFVPCQGNV